MFSSNCLLTDVKIWSSRSAAWLLWRTLVYKLSWQSSSSVMLTFSSLTPSWADDENMQQVTFALLFHRSLQKASFLGYVLVVVLWVHDYTEKYNIIIIIIESFTEYSEKQLKIQKYKKLECVAKPSWRPPVCYSVHLPSTNFISNQILNIFNEVWQTHT